MTNVHRANRRISESKQPLRLLQSAGIASASAPLIAAIVLFSLPAISLAAPGTLTGQASGRCLDVPGGNTEPRTPVIIYDCHGNINQQWEYTASGQLRTLGGTRCLDVRGGSTEPSAIVQSYPCHGGANQKWTLNTDGSIVNAKSGLCLTVIGAETANLTGVDMWQCQGAAHQKWKFSAGGPNPPPADTTPPTPPTNAKVSVLSCRSANVSWDASTDNIGVANYEIYRDGQLLGRVPASVRFSTVTTTPGANWGFYVNALDAAGNISQNSNVVQVQIPQCQIDTQPPTAPTGLSGTASGTTISLRWNAATDNIGVDSYDIFRNNVRVGNARGTTYNDSGLTANTTYNYTVAARDAQNNVSGRSNTAAVRTGGGCSNAICNVKEVARDRDIPWGLVTMPNGDILYAQRDVQDIIRMNASGTKVNIGKVPNVQGTAGEGGLLGIAATKDFPDRDSWLYIYHTSPSDNRIVRMRYTDGKLDAGSLQVLVRGIGKNRFHNGGRLRFGPDGKLYASTGDAQSGAFSQNINNTAGKILRLNPDGSVPSDNPFDNYVWSYGHRNPQGLAFDSQGRLWSQEFGDSIDETNLVIKGGNYGWPNCEGNRDRGGQGCATNGYIAPKRVYSNDQGSCSGIAIVRDYLYIACQRGQRLYRGNISSGDITGMNQYLQGTYGRLRTVEPSNDGGLWLTTSNPDGTDKDNTPNNSDTQILKIELGN